MDESTRAMKWAAIWQTVLVFVGTVAVVATLVLMVQANRAAVAAVNVTKDATERQLRPYICCSGAFAKDGFVGRNPSIAVTINNTGLTPASEFRDSVNVAVAEHPLKQPLSIRFKENASRGVLAPNVSAIHAPQLSQELQEWEIDAIRREVLAIYVYGRVEYWDPIAEKQRETEFRLKCVGSLAMEQGLFRADSSGNSFT